jgi:hypothetical protein
VHGMMMRSSYGPAQLCPGSALIPQDRICLAATAARSLIQHIEACVSYSRSASLPRWHSALPIACTKVLRLTLVSKAVAQGRETCVTWSE